MDTGIKMKTIVLPADPAVEFSEESKPIEPVRLALFIAALPYNLHRAGGLDPNEDGRRTRAIEDSIRCADESLARLRATQR